MVLEILRYTVFGLFVTASAMAVGSWAVRTRRISPFSRFAHMIRRATDPVLQPIEARLVRRGSNPQQAEWWLLGGTVVGGIVVISLAGWLADQATLVAGAGARGPGTLVRIALYYALRILWIAILIRVIASWIPVLQNMPFMRLVYAATDWLILPLRRVIPPIGAIDVSPLVAWFVVQILMSFVLR